MGILKTDERQMVHYLGRPDEVRSLNVREFCKRHAILLKSVGPAELDCIVGTFFDLPADEAGDGGATVDVQDPRTEEALPADLELFLLSGFDAQNRDQVLKEMREDEVGQAALKAMLTEQNAGWTLRRLLADVRREHEIMSAYMELRETVRMTGILIETVGLPPRAKQEFDLRYARAVAVTEGGQVPKDASLMRRLSKELQILITMGEGDDETKFV
jgi:hypothetical protein